MCSILSEYWFKCIDHVRCTDIYIGFAIEYAICFIPIIYQIQIVIKTVAFVIVLGGVYSFYYGYRCMIIGFEIEADLIFGILPWNA